MSLPLKYHVEQWALVMLADATAITAISFRHKVDELDADDSCILADVELGKRSETGDKHYEGKLTIELRARQDVTETNYLAYWSAIDAALRTCTSTAGAAYALANLPRGLLVHDEEASEDKEEWSDNFLHMSRTIPIWVCP